MAALIRTEEGLNDMEPSNMEYVCLAASYSRVIAECGLGDLSSQVLCRGEYSSSTKKVGGSSYLSQSPTQIAVSCLTRRFRPEQKPDGISDDMHKWSVAPALGKI